ncbi:MAG: RidA family protein [Bdellovibrionales bacterium]|nr:RidA family protein [Bdellovibrionales bacterium]
MTKKIVHTDNAPAAIGPYSQAVEVGEFLFTSGQIPLDPKTMEIVGQDITTQAHQVFKNLKAVLNAAGCDFKDVVKAGVFIDNMDDFPKLNDVYNEYLGEYKPARSTVEVAKLPKAVLVEIDLIAKLP